MNDELERYDEGYSLREVVELIVRRRRVILQSFCVVILLGCLITWFSVPVFESNSQVLVQSNRGSMASLDMDLPFKDLIQSSGARSIDTQKILIRSKAVLTKACELAKIPYREVASGQIRVTSDDIPDTDVVELTVDSINPDHAKRMTNSIIAAFRNNIQVSRQAAVTNAANYVNGRLAEESTKLEDAEMAFRRFKQSRHVVDVSKEEEAAVDSATDLRTNLANKEAEVAATKAVLDELERKRKTLPATINTPTTATNQLVLDGLKDRLAILENQRAQALVLVKPTEPKVQSIDQAISELQDRISQTPKHVTTESRTTNPALQEFDDKITEARGSHVAAIVAAAKMHAQFAMLTSGMNRFSALENEQAKLQREVERHLLAVTGLATSVDNLNIRANATDEPAQIISPASGPSRVSPSWPRNIALSVLLGLFLSALCAVLAEHLDDRLRTATDATQYLDAPVLGYVPLIEGDDPRIVVGDRRNGNLAETYRLLRSNVQFAAVDSPARSLVVTSALAGEGKSMTVYNLAIAAAMTGRRVIVVDADLRRPTQHERFRRDREPGLTNVLIGRIGLEEALQDTEVQGLRLLSCGNLPPNPAELLGSNRMRQVAAMLDEQADLVIYDTPPVLAAADTQGLASQVDGVLYVAHMGVVEKSAVRAAAEQLKRGRARILGVVFNKVVVGGRDRYGYGYGYGNGGYHTYHAYHQPYSQQNDVVRSASSHHLAAEFEALPLNELENGTAVISKPHHEANGSGTGPSGGTT